MRRPAPLTCAIPLLLMAACAAPGEAGGGEGAAGGGGEKVIAVDGIALFDGATLDGWECWLEGQAALEDVWSVQDGVLVCRGEPNGYLRTAAEYQDFALTVEWRWPGEPGNSGVLLRIAGEIEQMLPPSAEAQLRHGSVGQMYGFHGFRLDGPEDRLTEIRMPGWKLERMDEAENPAGEWNRYLIVARGGTITVELNGTLVNEATNCDVRPGRIGLQSEGGDIHFRRVELAPLPPAEG